MNHDATISPPFSTAYGPCNYGNAILWQSENSSYAGLSNDLPRATVAQEPRRVHCVLTLPQPVPLTDICATHLTNGSDYLDARARVLQTQKLRELIGVQVQHGSQPLYGGDFNAEPNDAALDYMYNSSYPNGLSQGLMWEATNCCTARFPPFDPTVGSRKLDYVFCGPTYAPLRSSTSTGFASDHKVYTGGVCTR